MSGLCIRSICEKDAAMVAETAAVSFAQDMFYKLAFPDEQQRKKEVAELHLKAIRRCEENGGDVLILEDDGLAVGFIMYFDYFLYRRQNTADFLDLFSAGIRQKKLYPRSFAQIHRQALQLPQSPTYILSIAVRPGLQNRGYGKALFHAFLQKFEKRVIMSDISGPFFLRICRQCGFELQPISESCFLAMKK